MNFIDSMLKFLAEKVSIKPESTTRDGWRIMRYDDGYVILEKRRPFNELVGNDLSSALTTAGFYRVQGGITFPLELQDIYSITVDGSQTGYIYGVNLGEVLDENLPRNDMTIYAEGATQFTSSNLKGYVSIRATGRWK